jgi:hypothetical protein
VDFKGFVIMFFVILAMVDFKNFLVFLILAMVDFKGFIGLQRKLLESNAPSLKLEIVMHWLIVSKIP